jgi:hypothetical protein
LYFFGKILKMISNIDKHEILSRIGRLVKERNTHNTTRIIIPKNKIVLIHIFTRDIQWIRSGYSQKIFTIGENPHYGYEHE